ncbi:IS200/IS605 family transposase [Halorhabdus tiamatea]|uniref:Transposase (IS891/IS1136/IS1341/IS605) n=1 Tax=Halorhabdus tiamatea SARL4B TaxID=1033806 RepID=F7PR87_9EURY|nr:IS200/IS605 family transposase [Halorhabdus tiamatea]CCQ34101.1 transposase (IS891/IS1136/IS1341/IS605) [Halorhabdus tiamatea SARL4B]CCQ34578.1 transposase (IS891/IS1136/IS1341/IS605) [Halorhabdus tiamatea SARL4B]
MKRANTFEVIPQSDEDEELLRRLLDASAALWNEINYERRENYADPDGDVWDISEYRGRYGGTLGASTVQQIERKNREAWKSFFSLKKKGEANGKPGFWGNADEGRELRTYIRNTSYSVEWGEYSRLEILVGQDLKDEYGLGHRERLRLEVRGEPNWKKYEKQGRLELFYDEQAQTFRAFQPVTVDDSRLAQPLASEEAALDIGANNLVACTTTTGQQYLYEGRDLFKRFRETTREIARLQSLLEDGRYSSHRIRRLYERRTKRRDHAQDALARDLIERLYDEGVSTVYVGALTDVLETHWSVETNAKTHNFWAFRAFVNRLACTAEEYGMSVEVQSEAWTSQECPNCGSIEDTTRHRDTLTCPCGFEGHADLVASETFLRRQTTVTRSMARPVCLKWDNHEWLESSRSPRPNEEHTNPQVASVGR